jgi:hypothetical protein
MNVTPGKFPMETRTLLYKCKISKQGFPRLSNLRSVAMHPLKGYLPPEL